MTAPTDQFVDLAKRSQEAVSTAVQTWADSVQGFAGNLNSGQAQLPDAQNVVDTYFDFVEKVLANQRELVTQFVTASVKAGENLQEQVSKATDQAAAQTVNGTEQVAAQVNEATAKTTRAARNATKN